MAAPEEALQIALEKFSSRGVKAIVDGIARDVTASTFTLVRENAPEIFDVRLNAVDDDLVTKLTIVPKEGSHVIVGIINNLTTEAVLLKCGEINQVLIKIGNTEVSITDQGADLKVGAVEFSMDNNTLKLKKAGDSLSQVLSDLIAEIAKVVVLIGTSPNVATLTQIDNRQKEFLG